MQNNKNIFTDKTSASYLDKVTLRFLIVLGFLIAALAVAQMIMK